MDVLAPAIIMSVITVRLVMLATELEKDGKVWQAWALTAATIAINTFWITSRGFSV